MTDRSRYYDTLRPYLEVEEAGGGWEWRVLDPRKRTPQGGPAVLTEGSADTRGLAYIVATSALARMGD